MGVNLICGKFLDETLGLIQGQELGYTDTHECGLFLDKNRIFQGNVRLQSDFINNRRSANRVFELTVDLCNHLTHGFQFGEHVVSAIHLSSHQAGHLRVGDCELNSRLKVPKCAFLTWLIIGPRRPLRVESFPNAFSRTVGKDRKRRVCPVGAVSKTITEYSIDLTCLGTSSIRARRSEAMRP